MGGQISYGQGTPVTLHASPDKPLHHALTHPRQPRGSRNAADAPLTGLRLRGKNYQGKNHEDSERGKQGENGLPVFGPQRRCLSVRHLCQRESYLLKT